MCGWSMTANEALILWNSRWRLENNVVSCRTCQAKQLEKDRGVAFAHFPGCGYAGQNREPWEDLDDICSRLSASP